MKREEIFAWLKDNNYTICLLQETHSGDGTHDIWKQALGDDTFSVDIVTIVKG